MKNQFLSILVAAMGFASVAHAQNKVDISKDLTFASAVRVASVNSFELKKQKFTVEMRVIDSGVSERPYNLIISLRGESDTHYVYNVGLSSVFDSKAAWINGGGSSPGVYLMFQGTRYNRATGK